MFCHKGTHGNSAFADTEHVIMLGDWNAYYALWSGDKPVYWLGQSLCTLLIQRGAIHSVAKFTQMEPLSMMQAARACLCETQ